VVVRPEAEPGHRPKHRVPDSKIAYLIGFCVLLFALIAAYGRQAHKAGRLGVVGVSVAIIGTVLLAGDLWFESFVVPWLAAGPSPQVPTSEPSMLFALGAISTLGPALRSGQVGQ
jgi:hypothetical protein